MVSSDRKMILRVLLLICAVLSVNAQTAINKGSPSTISGKVTIDGKGVSGLVVGLVLIETSSRSLHATRLKAVTDEDGNYQIQNVPPGSYQLMASAPAYVPGEGHKSVVVGENEVIKNIDITLVRGGVITGRVTDAEGRPVIEEEIFFSTATPTREFPYTQMVHTDDRGVYRAFGLPTGGYKVSAGKDTQTSFGRGIVGYQRTYHPRTLNAAEATVTEVNEGTEVTNVDITLGRPLGLYAARGRIIDGDSFQPLPNTHIGIQVFYDDGSSVSSTHGQSTKDGGFKFENLPPGKYAVYMDSPIDSELFSELVRFEVIDQDVEGLLIKAFKGGSVSGVVVLEGPPDPAAKSTLAGERILAFASNRSYGGRWPSANINADGSFRVTGLPAGQIMFQLQQKHNQLKLIRIERDGVVYSRGIEIKEREQITGLRVVVAQANGTIRGVLKLPEGLELPAKARLLLWVRKTDDPTAHSQPAELDARGQFVIPNLVAGTYEFDVRVVDAPSPPRILRPSQTVVVTNGAIADVTVTLQLPTRPSGP